MFAFFFCSVYTCICVVFRRRSFILMFPVYCKSEGTIIAVLLSPLAMMLHAKLECHNDSQLKSHT